MQILRDVGGNRVPTKCVVRSSPQTEPKQVRNANRSARMRGELDSATRSSDATNRVCPTQGRRIRLWLRKDTLGVAQRKVFTTPLLSEAQKCRNTKQFTKKKSRCQKGGVRGVAYQNATTERTN